MESNRDWHDSNICNLRSTLEGSQEEHEDQYEQNVTSPLTPGDAQINFGGEATTSTEAQHLPPATMHPTFPFLMRIPAFLLDDYLHIPGQPFIEGIATSSHVDEIEHTLLYRMHL